MKIVIPKDISKFKVFGNSGKDITDELNITGLEVSVSPQNSDIKMSVNAEVVLEDCEVGVLVK